jgi:hypothetical protein
VLLASSLSEAKKLAAEDPDHVRGIGTMEVFGWNAHRALRLNGPTVADEERLAAQDNDHR